ncbi:MAG: DUF1214 domain-containing protein [Microvirga sp.]
MDAQATAPDAAGATASPSPRGASPARARRRFLDRLLSPFVMVVYAVGLGLGLGLGSAYEVLRGSFPFGSVEIGPWTAWPEVGSGKADPYARAIVARTGDVPLALGEGLALVATRDSAGQPLDGACTYRLGALMPQARLWTLSVYDDAGRPIDTELKRTGFTSAEILRRPDDTFIILLSRRLQPGNWIRLPAGGPFTIGLRLYDMPGIGGAAKLGADALPSIERLECGS